MISEAEKKRLGFDSQRISVKEIKVKRRVSNLKNTDFIVTPVKWLIYVSVYELLLLFILLESLQIDDEISSVFVLYLM